MADSNNNTEIWKPVKGWEGYYEISNFGRLKGVHIVNAHLNERIRIPKVSRYGYLVTSLYAHTRRKDVSIHRLVAEVFLPPDNIRPQVNHKDGNKKNNRADNLEWCTCQENIRHGRESGLWVNEPTFPNRKGQCHPNHKLTDKQVNEIRNSDLPAKQLAKKYNVHWSVIYRCWSGERQTSAPSELAPPKGVTIE